LVIIIGSMGILYPTSPATGTRHCFAGPAIGSSGALVVVVVAHGLVLAALLLVVPAKRVAEFVRPLAVRLIELAPKASPPLPIQPKPQRQAPVIQPRILAVTASASAAPALFVVPPQPAPVEAAVPPAPTFVAAPTPVTAARFDADYLQNPRPAYPSLSRRLGEEGRVVLRVFVSPTGHPDKVDLANGSGYPRLDAAAREAVAQWRFVPARRGDDVIADWVRVPIVFKLEN
jgi:protein TonB